MKVTIELETTEEREIFGASNHARFVKARSTAIFFRREMVPLARHQTGIPIGYVERAYVEVALGDIEFVEIPLGPDVPMLTFNPTKTLGE